MALLLIQGVINSGMGAIARPKIAHYEVPGARERAGIGRAIVREKLHRSLLPALRGGGVDMWIVLDRENNADPLHEEVGGGYSGTRAAYVFYDRGGDEAEKIYIGSSEQPVDSVISADYDEKHYSGGRAAAFASLLRTVVHERRPKTIAINTSEGVASSDGLTATSKELLLQAIGPEYASRIVSAERVVHLFRANRTPLETRWYRQLQQWTDRWQTEVLTSGRIAPGRTTVLDVVTILEDRAVALGFAPVVDHGRFPIILWFGDRAAMPGLSGFDVPLVEGAAPAGSAKGRDTPIPTGSLITVDGGLSWLGFATDMKRSAYLLKRGEREAPTGLQQAWKSMLTVAELYGGRMRPGATGRQVWQAVMRDLEALGFKPAGVSQPGPPARPQVGIYGHPTGNVVHDVGARVAQDALPDLPLVEGEWASVEFHIATPAPDVPGGQWIARFEQTGQVGREGLEWLVPIQKEVVLIGGAAKERRR